MGEGNRRLALIVACDRYADPDLKQLQAPTQDAERFARLLEDPKIGGFEVTSLINQPYWAIREKIDEFLYSCNIGDTILLYFSCHGIKDENGRLHFATVTTNRKRLFSTGIESNFVNEELDKCRARQKVVLLDCCYSGAFKKGRFVRADEQVNVTEFFGKGSVIISASDSIQYAFEGDNIKSLRTGSYFTNALIRGLESGEVDENNDGKITYSELYDYLYDSIRSITSDQTPTLNTRGVEGDFVLFRNLQANKASVSSATSPSGPSADLERSKVNDPILEYIEIARVLLEEKRYDQAINIFDAILIIRSEHVEALNGKGMALYKQRKYKEALESFEKVLKINPKNPLASDFVELITERISKEHSVEAKASSKGIEQNAALEKQTEEKVKKALDESSQIPSELILKGNEFSKKAMYHKAILWYDKALKLESHSESAWSNKGFALFKMGEFEQARACFKQASEINPTSLAYLDYIRTIEQDHIRITSSSHNYIDLKRFYKNSYAIIIGISKYKEEIPLPNAYNDAWAVKKVLEEKYEFSMLVPPLFNQDATKGKIEEVFIDILHDENRISTKDRVVIYYSGHGKLRTYQGYEGQETKEGYIVPSDSKLNRYSTNISMKSMIESCQNCVAKHVLLILDCCYSGYAITRGGVEPERPRKATDRFLDDITSRRTIQVLAAGQEDQPVSDSGIRPGYSAFTGALLDILEPGLDLDNDAILTASEIALNLEKHIANQRGKVFQRPAHNFISGSKGGDFVFKVFNI